tara:strand:+ start:8628 stop:11384 length:2757 start_codon:yes stop_codon:yes gene_type:complete
MALRDIQPNLSGGELDPRLFGRVDLSKFESGLETCRNGIVLPFGGVSNRPGFHFVGEVQDSNTAVRIIPFSFNTDQTYILVFGNLTLRVIKDGGFVVEATKAITGATQADPVVVTAAGHGYSNGDEVYVTGVVGMTQLNGRNFKVAGVTTNTFQIQDLGGTNINGSAYTAYASGGTAARVYTQTTPWASADLFRLKYTQSADTLTVTHPSHAPRDVTRTAHDNWTITEITFGPLQARPATVAGTANSTGSETVRYHVTSYSDDTGEESLPGFGAPKTITGITQANPAVVTANAHGFVNGSTVYISGVSGMTEVNDKEFKVANKTTNTFELQTTNSTSYSAYTSGGTVKELGVTITNSAASGSMDNDIDWDVVEGADSYNVYKQENGWYGFIGSTELTVFQDTAIEGDAGDTPPKQRNPFDAADKYPMAVSYYEQRKVFGGTNTDPTLLEFSQTANFHNMSISSPRKDDDAISRSIASREVNEIRALVPMTDLIVLTSGGEWRVQAGESGVLTPTSISVKPQQYHGASHTQPIVAGGAVLFIQHQGRTVRSLAYSFESDGYKGTDMSLLASHLFENNTLLDWAYAEVPDSVIWCVRDDGTLLGMTYLRDHEIYGWHRHDTEGGVFESVASVTEGSDDYLYAVVKRTINSRTVRYIERLNRRYFDDVEDAFFVDSGLSLDSPIAVSGYTSANPVVITATAHGLSNGDTVDIEGIKVTDSAGDVVLSPTLNRNGWKVANVTSNTFELQDSDGANVNGTALDTYASGGNVREAVTTVSGLWHLEGETVSALANGSVVNNLTVTNGAVTIPSAASRVHVGYPFQCDVQTLNLSPAAMKTGTIQTRKVRIDTITARVDRTRGIYAGPDSENLTEAKQFLQDLHSGDIKISITSKWDKDGQIFLRQPNPLPFTVLAITAEYSVGD